MGTAEPLEGHAHTALLTCAKAAKAAKDIMCSSGQDWQAVWANKTSTARRAESRLQISGHWSSSLAGGRQDIAGDLPASCLYDERRQAS